MSGPMSLYRLMAELMVSALYLTRNSIRELSRFISCTVLFVRGWVLGGDVRPSVIFGSMGAEGVMWAEGVMVIMALSVALLWAVLITIIIILIPAVIAKMMSMVPPAHSMCIFNLS